jgi:hypothetical protein
MKGNVDMSIASDMVPLENKEFLELRGAPTRLGAMNVVR